MPRGGFRPGAGRPKAAHTIKAEEYRKTIVEQVHREALPMVLKMIARVKKGDL